MKPAESFWCILRRKVRKGNLEKIGVRKQWKRDGRREGMDNDRQVFYVLTHNTIYADGPCDVES